MNKKESKYFSTAQKMDRALLALLEKKNFEYVTVAEICRTAGVNRSTFYLHYENTVDLLDETTRYVIDDFLTYFQALPAGPAEEGSFMQEKYVLPYLTYIRDNRRVFMTALKHLNTMGFETYYDRLFSHIFSPILDEHHVPAAHKGYIMKFYLTGVTAVAMEWLKRDCAEPLEDICGIILRCTADPMKRHETP